MNEAILHERVLNYFRGKQKQIFSEVPFMSRKIDLVLLEKDSITTYELKIKKWKHAIEQMKEHRIAANYCYLLMPMEAVGRKLRQKITDELSFFGFGFSLWNEDAGEINTVLTAQNSGFIVEHGAVRLRENTGIYACQ